MADEDPNEMVYITHPDTAALGGPVTRQSVQDIHRHKGWTVADPDEVAALQEDKRIAALTERSEDEVRAERLAAASGAGLTGLTVPQLRRRADEAGLSLGSKATKAELITALQGAGEGS